jgi:hypothetical protein
MTMRYFQLIPDYGAPTPWRLAEPVDAQGQALKRRSMFMAGAPVHVEGRLKVGLVRPGKPYDFSPSDRSETPIVHERLAKIFAWCAPDAVQLLPVDIEGQAEPHSLLVATKTVRCIDESMCVEVKHWTPEDGFESMVGQYKSSRGVRIDPTKVGRPQVFRPWGWKMAFIVSENIQRELAFSGFTGMDFQEVTGPKEEQPQ